VGGGDFEVFIKDSKGPLWKGFFATLGEAKQKAQEFATSEQCEAFVYSFVNECEVQRTVLPC
jgi:hypothetical protein